MASQYHDFAESLCDALVRISIGINSNLEMSGVLSQVVESTRSILKCSDSGIVLWDKANQHFVRGASTNVGDEVTGRIRREGGATRWIIDHARPVIVPDTRNDPFTANPMIWEHGVHAYAGVPIMIDAEPTGALYALFAEVREFDQNELVILNSLASMSATAISNARLIKAIRDADDFRKALLELAAHDLRNPLTLALGYVSLLKDSLPASMEGPVSLASNAHTALNRINVLIEDLLGYQRLSTADLVMRPCNVSQLLREVAVEFEPLVREKGHSLNLRIDPVPFIIQADEPLLRQAAGNLISNAIKYTPDNGTITLEVDCDRNLCVISVTDTGPGIPQEQHQELFKPFVRLPSAGTTPGSGLGLSLVQGIVQRHSGRVEVSSTPGNGATFSLILPVDHNDVLPPAD